jgi:hypothetical protein
MNTSWKAFLNSRASNAAGNNVPSSYKTTWDQNTSHEAKLNLLNNDPDSVALAGNWGGIIILHNFKNLGGTVFAPADKVVCLLGVSHSAPVVIVNKIALTDAISISTPPQKNSSTATIWKNCWPTIG